MMDKTSGILTQCGSFFRGESLGDAWRAPSLDPSGFFCWPPFGMVNLSPDLGWYNVIRYMYMYIYMTLYYHYIYIFIYIYTVYIYICTYSYIICLHEKFGKVDQFTFSRPGKKNSCTPPSCQQANSPALRQTARRSRKTLEEKINLSWGEENV